ncbi:MAG: hypothetical protein DRN95_08725, partial [Candidatus Hydrothermarchaeota archaeon]
MKRLLEEVKSLKRIVSGVMLTLLLTGILTLAFNIQPVKTEWTGTVYIRADGSVDPPDAPIITYDNITYTLTDNITSSADGIIIERSNIIIDGAGYTLQALGSGRGFYLSGISNVTIKNTNINNFEGGLWLDSSSNNSISGNNIADNRDGIRLDDSSNNSISGNNMTNNSYGIRLHYSSNNSISGNNITANNFYGLWLDSSSNNSISGNNIADNRDGLWLHYSSNNSISGNNITANNDDGLWLDDSSNNSISGNNIADNRDGLWLDSSSNNSISGNNITANNDDGLWLGYSSNNSISGNNITANNDDGLWLDSSSNNSISGNNIADNRYNFGVWGFALSDFINYVDASNLVDGKPLYYWINRHHEAVPPDAGYVALVNSTHITVQNLNLTKNGQGILIAYTHNSTIKNNNMANNLYGLWLISSSNNAFYHNNIIDNKEQVCDWLWEYPYAPSINVWDDDYPSGGNYWSDYAGVDLYSGPYQNVSGSDGIGDTPYVIDENNVDRYPLMSPWSPKPVNATVDVNPKALNLRSWGKWITAYVELPEGYDVADIDVSTIMLNGTVPVDLCAPILIGDYDNDSIPDLMVSFNGTLVSSYILSSGVVFGNVTLTLTGQLYNRTFFEGSDIILVSAL